MRTSRPWHAIALACLLIITSGFQPALDAYAADLGQSATTGVDTYPLTDALGSVRATTDDTGTVGGADSFSYDWGNRLTSATVGGSTVDYAYTGDDLRVSRTEGGVTESYLWDRLSALPTMVSDGSATSVHGPTGIANEITGTTASYALPDGLGSVRAWAGSSGTAIGATDWDVWGNIRSTTGAVGLHGFTGERTDPSSGLVYLRARDYSPGTARFVQPDPIQPNAEGTHGYNPYWYANANPATFTDPMGTSAGVVTGSAFVGASLSAGGAYNLTLTGTLLARAAPLLILGGWVAWIFTIIVIVIFVAILIHEVNQWCASHDCSLAAITGEVGGWIETVSTQTGTTVKMGWRGIATGTAAACVLALAFSPDILAQPVAQGCGIPNNDCLNQFVRNVVEDVLWGGSSSPTHSAASRSLLTRRIVATEQAAGVTTTIQIQARGAQGDANC